MKKILINIHSLVHVEDQRVSHLRGTDMDKLKILNNAFLEIEDGRIAGFGIMDELKPADARYMNETIDCTGKWVLPGFADSHTHIIFAEDRAAEFEDRIRGLSYEEIAARGGGIVNSAAKLASKPEDELYRDALKRIEACVATGTVAMEIKSGYGLTTEAELKMLRVAKRLQKNAGIPIKTTFLGAHAIPPAYKENREGYIQLLIKEMLPAIAKEKLADYIDVFCEKNYFTVEDTHRILEAGAQYGLRPKVHVNQFHSIGGIHAALQHNALSVDHLEVMNNEDIHALHGSDCMPVALPGCSFFLNIPYAPVRKMIDVGLPVALASDYNPGSSPSGNLLFAWSLACIHMKMTPNEALAALTHNAAYALELEHELGSIAVGKKANILITSEIDSLALIPYHFGSNLLEEVWVNGTLYHPNLEYYGT